MCTVIPFPVRPRPAPANPYAHLMRAAYIWVKTHDTPEDKLAAVREAFASAKPAGEPEMLKLLRRIDRRLATLQKGAAA